MSSAPRRKIYLTMRSVCSIRLFARLREDRRMPDPRPRSPARRAGERRNNLPAEVLPIFKTQPFPVMFIDLFNINH
jgi:hypothetical protein